MKRYRSPRRIKQRKSFLRSWFFWTVVLLLISAELVFYSLFLSPFFQVKNIEVQGNRKVGSSGIKEKAREAVWTNILFFPTQSIFLLSEDKAAEEIKNTFVKIGSVALHKKFPGSLTVQVQERQEVAVWCHEQCFALDKKGIMFESAKAGGKLVISSSENQPLFLGEQVVSQELLATLLDFQSRFSQFPLAKEAELAITSLLLVSEERVNAATSEGWEIYLNPAENSEWQLEKIRAVLEQKIPAEKRKNLEYIDLRFGDQAYIQYKN